MLNPESSFINCNICVSGNYRINNAEKYWFKFKLINSHISVSYNEDKIISPIEKNNVNEISGVNWLFNHTHNGPNQKTNSIPFYAQNSNSSGYLAPSSITAADKFLETPNNYTTFGNFVYKNLTELPVGVFLLSDDTRSVSDFRNYGFQPISGLTNGVWRFGKNSVYPTEIDFNTKLFTLLEKYKDIDLERPTLRFYFNGYNTENEMSVSYARISATVSSFAGNAENLDGLNLFPIIKYR